LESEFDSKHLLYKISLNSLVWYIILGGSGEWINYYNTKNTKTGDKINGSSKLKNILQTAI